MFSTALAKASAGGPPKATPPLTGSGDEQMYPNLQGALKSDRAVDIGRIVRSAGFFDVATNRVELGPLMLLCRSRVKCAVHGA